MPQKAQGVRILRVLRALGLEGSRFRALRFRV